LETPADSGWRGYSLEERDRRWRAVRENAARAGLDCVLVPKGNRIDSRYLTQIENACFILPADGRPPVVMDDRGTGNAWIAEVRSMRRGDRPRWGPPIAEALLELGMERARIGVVGMGPGTVTHARAADGVLNYDSFAEIVSRLPKASFEDGTDVVGFARYVKSPEELDCLRRAVAIAEEGIAEMVRTAGTGVDEAVLYGRVSGRMTELGSEHYCVARTDWTAHGWALETGPADGHGTRFTGPPIGRRLQAGTLISNEVSAIWGGMVAQEVQPILVGSTLDEWQRLVDLQREVFEAGLSFMKAGMTYLELVDFVRGSCRMPGFKAEITLHGRGMGDDGPLITGRSENAKLANLRMEQGNAWVWKPVVHTTEGPKREFQFGGTVALTERGVERFFQRPHRFVTVA